MPELARPLKCGSIMTKGSSTLDYINDIVTINPTIQIVGFLAPFPIDVSSLARLSQDLSMSSNNCVIARSAR